MLNRITKYFHTLKFRLMFLITIVLLIVVGLPVGLYINKLDKNYHEFSINMIEVTTQIVYQFIYDGMMNNDSLKIQHNLELLAKEPTIDLLRIYKPTGEVLYSTEKDEISKNISDLKNNFNYDETAPILELFVEVGNIYFHRHPIYIQKECTVCHIDRQGDVIAVLDVQAGFNKSEHMYVSAKKIALIGAILIVVILWIITNLLYQSQIESRLLIIINGFDNLAKGNFKSKIKMPGRHELAILAEKFNNTVEKLKLSREKEEQFYQDKLERADRLVTLGEVAAEIAHEVNNPAGIILTRTEYIKDVMGEKCPECPAGNDLGIIINQTERIAEITRSILHYARKLPRSFSVIDLNEVIQHSVRILNPRIKKLNTKIHLRLNEKSTLVWGNFSQLEQVFCNLINNSLDVVPELIGVVRIVILSKNNIKRKNYYEVICHDNGPGIPQENRVHIFSPFFTTKEDDKGTGLGLFIARNIINNHGGKMLLKDDKEGGAWFVIELERYYE